MSDFDVSPAQRILREFAVRRDRRGHWVASELHGLGEGVFFTCKDACRFALQEADGDRSRVHIEEPGPVQLTPR
jgi:hypothetical protein